MPLQDCDGTEYRTALHGPPVRPMSNGRTGCCHLLSASLSYLSVACAPPPRCRRYRRQTCCAPLRYHSVVSGPRGPVLYFTHPMAPYPPPPVPNECLVQRTRPFGPYSLGTVLFGGRGVLNALRTSVPWE